jgi:hypothetical protein
MSPKSQTGGIVRRSTHPVAIIGEKAVESSGNDFRRDHDKDGRHRKWNAVNNGAFGMG